MTNSPIEQEPGRARKVEQYIRYRRAQIIAERALGRTTLEQALSGIVRPSELIEEKDRLEQAAGIIRRDLKGQKTPSKP